MKRLRKFLDLPASDQAVLISSVLLIWVIRLGLSLLSFRNLCVLLSRLEQVLTRPSELGIESTGERIVWGVGIASRFMPGTQNCLAQALAARVLLGWQSSPACVCIGVARGEKGELKAHAWVESGGKIILGGDDVSDYASLIALEG